MGEIVLESWFGTAGTSRQIRQLQEGADMTGFLGEKEILTRERVKEILARKEYSFLEQKVSIVSIDGDRISLRISFLLEYRKRMISVEEKDPIVLSFGDFKVEDWGDGIRKLADIE